MESGVSRIDPIVPKEPGASRQDSSDCLKTGCFPFKNAFDDEEEKPGDGTCAPGTLVLTKAQFQSGALTTANRKSLLRHEQFLSGVEDDSFKKHTLLQGEIHTGTGLILEKDAMVEGEVWGDKHDKQDKFNEQVLSSGQFTCGEVKMEGESSISKPRRKLGEEQENTIQQLDGQFDTKDSEKEDVPMIIDDFPYECNGTSPFLDSNLPENLDSSSSNLPNLLGLSWDDILYTSLMPLMSIEEIFRLRATSRGFRSMVDGYFMQLRNLDLTAIGSRFTTHAFKIITDNNENLRCINLTGCKCITNDLLTPVLYRNERLHTIDLSECHHLADGCLQPILDICVDLKRLVLSNCHWVSRRSMKYLAQKQPPLITLNLTGCWELCDETLIQIVESIRTLQFLSVSNIYSLTDKTMAHVAAYCPLLLALDIVGCWRISDNGVKRIAEYCKHLKLLKIQDCRDVTEASLARLRKRGVNLDRPVDPLTIRLGARRGVIPVEALYDEEPLPVSLRLQV